METFTLLIWHEIPETTRLFLIPNSKISDDDSKVLLDASGSYINQYKLSPNALKAVCALQAALVPSEHPEWLSPTDDNRMAHQFTTYEVDPHTPIQDKMISNVFISGIFL